MPDELSSRPLDQRQQQRLERVHALYSWEYQPDLTLEQYGQVQDIIPHFDELDATILKYAPKHAISDFNRMDLAILRQALYELMYTQTPPVVIINEAIEIAKEYGSDQSPQFINGVLGNYWDDTKQAGQ